MTNRTLIGSLVALVMLVAYSAAGYAYEKKSINVKVNGVSRNMVVFEPANVTVNLPLMIVTHGMNQNPEYQMENDNMFELVDSERFVLVYLRSNGTTWDIDGTGDQKFVEQAIVEMYTRYDIDPHRVYWTGFSMGSMLMYHSMANMQGKIAAFAPTSGVQFSEQPWNRCQKPVNLIHCHSYKDQTFTYDKYSIHEYVENMAMMNNSGAVQKNSSFKNSTLTGVLETWENANGNVVKLFSYNEGGHWPQTPNSKLIWDFCKQFSIADKDLDPIEKGPAPGGTYSANISSEVKNAAASLDGKTLLVTDAYADAMWYCNSSLESPQNVRNGSLSDYEDNPYCYFTFHKISSPGCATTGNLYTIQITDESGSKYSVWGNDGYLNTPPEAWCLFALGITAKTYGQDADYCGLWKVDYEEGKGYTIQNVGVSEAKGGGGYIHPSSAVPVSEKGYLRMFSKVIYKAPTAVEKVLADADANGRVYDLSGRCVSNTLPGQIYIKSGRKFVAQ